MALGSSLIAGALSCTRGNTSSTTTPRAMSSGSSPADIATILNVTVADSSGGQARSWFALVESRDAQGTAHRLRVFISPLAKAKDANGNTIPLPGIAARDRVRLWLKDIMQLSEPAQVFADSLQVVSTSR